MDYENEEYNEEPEEEDIFSDNSLSVLDNSLQSERPMVSQEELIDRWENKNTARYKREIFEMIDDTGFFYSTKKAIKTFAHTYLNSPTFMANLTPQKSTSWGTPAFDPQKYNRDLAELLLLENRCAYAKMDTMKPELLVFERSLLNHLELIISRTVGPNREGIVNRESRSRAEQTMNTRDMNIINTPTKKKKFI